MDTSVRPRLHVQNLTRVFDGHRAVDDVSLSLMPGQVTCLLGPSGCGKSTTLRIIAGVERQTTGTIYVDGGLVCDGVNTTPPEQRAIGLMFQDFALFPHLRVWENVAFGLKGPKSERRARALTLLDRVDLSGFSEKMPQDLSGGEQQRVALARAIAPKPRIMLMDEPFSGLDDRLRDDV
ncbi:MAG: ATP-binding cassette domain-containing protein, partial [Pseudomonadota bacterium]